MKWMEEEIEYKGSICANPDKETGVYTAVSSPKICSEKPDGKE